MVKYLKHGDSVPTSEPRRFKNVHGYVVLRWRVGPRQYVEALEHRVAMGLPLPTVHVHHRNGIKDDNRPENLELMTERDHHRLHVPISFDVEEAASLYAQGWTTVQLGERYSIDSSCVWRALSGRGVRLRSHSEALHVAVDADAVRRMHLAGYSAPAIAKALDVPVGTVRRTRRALQLPSLPSGRRPTGLEAKR